MKNQGKHTKAQEAQKAQGRPEEAWSFLRLPGPSWGSLVLVPSLGLPDSPGLPGSLDSLSSRGGAPVSTSLGTLPGAFQKVLGPPERGCKGASIKEAWARCFFRCFYKGLLKGT